MGVKVEAEKLLLSSCRMKDPTEKKTKEMSHILSYEASYGHQTSFRGTWVWPLKQPSPSLRSRQTGYVQKVRVGNTRICIH